MHAPSKGCQSQKAFLAPAESFGRARPVAPHERERERQGERDPNHEAERIIALTLILTMSAADRIGENLCAPEPGEDLVVPSFGTNTLIDGISDRTTRATCRKQSVS